MGFFVFFSKGEGRTIVTIVWAELLKNYCDIVYKCTIMINCSKEASGTATYKNLYLIDVDLRNFAYVSSFSQFLDKKRDYDVIRVT